MKKIRIKSGKSNEFNTNFKIKGIEYHIQTEEGSEKFPFITTTVFLGGSIVDKLKTPYPFKDSVGRDELEDIMARQHQDMIEKIKRKHLETTKSRNDYIREIRRLINRRKLGEAAAVVEDAAALYPDDPFIMSFSGYLAGAAKKDFKGGIETCKKALSLYRARGISGGDYYLHFFYLNLGRLYLETGRRDMAVQHFYKAIEFDPDNREVTAELERLGIRKRPVIPFLPRKNFINKYLGLLLSRLGLR